MAASTSSRRIFSLVVRRFSSSPLSFARFRFSNPSTVREVGKFTTPRTDDSLYEPGQLFIHRAFAYKGIIVCSFSCKVHEKRPQNKDQQPSSEDNSFYQVLIHRPDWSFMGFPVDITSYLADAGPRAERQLTTIIGMDIVSHKEVLPMETNERIPIDHDLFPRIFMPESEDNGGVIKFGMRPELVQNYMASRQSWLAPRDVYKETTENIEVTVTTFYLGSTMMAGQQKHCWRYVIRLENLEPKNAVVLRERNLKVFSLNNMHQLTGAGVVGTQPELSVTRPAFQFSSTVDLPQPKGGHMWGKFKMERENGSFFEVTIPTIVLESFKEVKHDKVEKIVE